MTHPTRRQVLSVLGASGATAFVGHNVLARGRELPYQQYTYASSESGALRIAWYETYNGDVREVSGNATSPASVGNASSAAYVADVDGPVIQVENVLPGDWGRLIVGLTAEDAPHDVWVRVTATDAPDNLVEPERDAPGGTLSEVTDAAVWIDASPCDGLEGMGDDRVVGGTLDRVAGALESGVRLDLGGSGDCPSALPVGDPRCIGFRWALATAVDNRAMSDRVSFDVEFAGVDCGSTNPFEAAQ